MKVCCRPKTFSPQQKFGNLSCIWEDVHPSLQTRRQWKILGQEPGCYCKLLKITVSVCCFCWNLSICKNQHHSSIQSWHIADLIFRITFGRPRYAWPHPYKWTGSNRCICVRLTTRKKSASYLQSVFSNQLHTWVHSNLLL